MPFVLGDDGAFVVETHGIARRVAFSIDPIRQIPKVELIESPSPIVGQNRRRRGANFYNLPPPTPGSTRISNSAWSGAAPATK